MFRVYFMLKWGIPIALITVLFPIIFKWINSRLKDEDRLSKKDIEDLQKEKFSFKYKLYLGLLLSLMFTSFIGLGLLGFKFFTGLQRNSISRDFVVFIPSTLSLVIFFSVSALVGLSIGFLLVNSVLYFSPKLAMYMTMLKQKNWNIQRKSNGAKALRFSMKFFYTSLIFGLFVLFIASDNYYYITSDSIYENKFISLSERRIDLSQIDKVEIELFTVEKDLTKVEARYNYFLILNDDQRINLNEAKLNEISRLNMILQSKDIPINVKMIDNNFMEQFEKQKSNEDIIEMRKIITNN